METNIVTVADAEKAFPPTKYNSLLPGRTTVIGNLPSLKRIVFEEIVVDLDNDVFELPSKKKVGSSYVRQFSPGKRLLDKIALAVGINWGKPEILHMDKDRVVVTIKGTIPKPDGIGTYVVSGSKEVDALAYGEEKRASLEQMLVDGKLTVGWGKEAKVLQPGSSVAVREIDRRVKALEIQIRKHKFARAESGAMERVIRSAVALKSTYLETELKKPFIVPRFDFNPEAAMRDPLLRSQMTGLANEASSKLYGGDVEPRANNIDGDAGETATGAINNVTEVEPDKNDISQVKESITREELKSLSADDRFDSLTKLINDKNLVNDNGQPIKVTKTAFKKKTVSQQIDNIVWAMEQPDNSAKQSVTDELPF